MSAPDPNRPEPTRYEQLSRQPAPGAISDLIDFLRTSKRWWLAPIVVVFLVFGALLALGSAGGAPFIYTLF